MSHAYAEPTQEREREAAAPSPVTQQNEVVSSRPPIVCAAPLGAAQGGLLDWFRGMFGGTSNEEAGADTMEETVGQTAGQANAAAEEQQWKDDSYGPMDLSLVTTKPDNNSPLNDYVQNYTQEGPAQAPIFETHSFVPREAVDNEGMEHLHSFIGLRFTQMDKDSARYTRKRLKVGFGGGGSAFADHGTLMNDYNTQADMSTETPIRRDQLEAVMNAIPAEANKPYNVLTHNCNHFTQSLAEMVGASVPAQLHDSVLGPIGAYKNLANAAEQGQQGRTRFFQGGGMGKSENSQMFGERGKELVSKFTDTARSAARWDGLPFMLYPSLSGAAERVQEAAAPMKDYLGIPRLQSENDEQRVETIVRSTTEAAEDLIHLHLWKGHPRVNMAAMKVIAMANNLHSTLLPEHRPIGSYSEQELNAVLTQPTKAEENAKASYDQSVRIYKRTHREDKIAGLKRGVENEDLFSSTTNRYDPAGSQQTLSGPGAIFLQSMGLEPHALIREFTPASGKDRTERCMEMLRRIRDAAMAQKAETAENEMCVDTYLSVFSKGRDNLTPSQLGALTVHAMLGALQEAASRGIMESIIRSLGSYSDVIASNRSNDSLDNAENNRVTKAVDRFTGKTEKRDADPARLEILKLVNEIEKAMAAKFEEARAGAARPQTSTER